MGWLSMQMQRGTVVSQFDEPAEVAVVLGGVSAGEAAGSSPSKVTPGLCALPTACAAHSGVSTNSFCARHSVTLWRRAKRGLHTAGRHQRTSELGKCTVAGGLMLASACIPAQQCMQAWRCAAATCCYKADSGSRKGTNYGRHVSCDAFVLCGYNRLLV